MTVAGALQATDVQQRCAVGGWQARCGVFFPALFIDLKVYRGEAREQGKDAADRAQVAAPDPLAAGEQQPDDDGSDGRTAKNQQRRLGVIIDADQLAIDGGQDERQGWPATPAHPAWHAHAPAILAGPFAQRAFRAQHTAPEPAEQYDRQQHERPPEAPEQELGEQGQVVQHPRLAVGQRQQCR
ncbi:hypothetical protein D3C80_1228420 [compost metagenome]